VEAVTFPQWEVLEILRLRHLLKETMVGTPTPQLIHRKPVPVVAAVLVLLAVTVLHLTILVELAVMVRLPQLQARQ